MLPGHHSRRISAMPPIAGRIFGSAVPLRIG
jgi:hypothetical protein